MKRLMLTIMTITTLCLVASGFQNCAEEVNLDQYKTSSSTSTPPPGPVIVPDPPPTLPPPILPPQPVVEPKLPAAITSYPTSTQSVTFESAFSLAVAATGTGTLSYAWYKNNSIRLSDDARITGTNTNVLNFNKVEDADTGTYSVEVRNSYGSDMKSVQVNVSRTANQYPPTLAANGGIKDVTGYVTLYGNSSSPFYSAYVPDMINALVKFSVQLSNTTNVSYQWFRVDAYGRATLIPGQTGPTYSFNITAYNYTTTGAAGKHRVVATNPYGSLTSEAVLHIVTTVFYPDSP